MTLEQAWLEPAIEVFHAPVAVGLRRWDQYQLGSEAQTQPNDSRKITCGRSPADDFAGVVELDAGRATEALPAFAQEVENGFHLAGTVDSQANRAIVGVFADENIVPLPLTFEINGTDAVYLMKLIGLVHFGCRIGMAR